ncbi:rRNA maturation RNase YbeY [Pelagicoccus sp. SDUM812005]|uniref:rRNA maturation RNase YbeY n=1 Tax=Pelagicoccus sp. SDUM812005 TaxID=3041257 RepID=UPI0028108026|nr:rRNA maturation RNase YbeY [Pelagicoccus sp. SDUM812005]MDQ8180013.1 rRNA maturation RNase YbeY [Pelagicoccus sp. SDUM812005]
MTEKQNAPARVQVNSLCPKLGYDESEIERLIRALDKAGAFDAPPGELSIAFVDKEYIAQLHDQFMGDPTPTDVITFPPDPDIDQAGEVIVCPQVAREYAKKENLDFSHELSLYIIHGYLHLCGFDDIEETDRALMRRAEQQALEIARKAKAMPSFSLS